MTTDLRAPITAVTVLEDRASITRRGSCSLAAGQHRLMIENVSPILADKTLSATIEGARLLDVRCERYLAPWRDPAGDAAAAPAQLRAERDRLVMSRDAALARAHAARVEIAALAEVAEAALGDLSLAATRGIQVADASGQLAELDLAEAAACARSALAELDADQMARAIDRMETRLARVEAEAGEHGARLVLDVVVEAAAKIAVSVGYVVPGAAWRPYHRAILIDTRVDWQTTACIWQSTGEDWVDAALICSLERPSLGVEPPPLADDLLRMRRRADSVVVEAREQREETTGLGGSAAEVPGIDDGGIGMTLAAPNATIRADGRPHRVPVGGFIAAVELSLVAIPLRSAWVHHRARIINGLTPLLAGPVDLVMSSGYVGRAEIGFVAAGEKFYVGFGPEAEIRVHRDEQRERDEAGILGTWNTQTIRVAVRLSNLGGSKREVVVTERIPISLVEQVQVEAAPADAYLLGADDQPGGEEITQVTARALDERGMVSWSVELPPFGRRAVTLEYRVKSQRGVAGI